MKIWPVCERNNAILAMEKVEGQIEVWTIFKDRTFSSSYLQWERSNYLEQCLHLSQPKKQYIA